MARLLAILTALVVVMGVKSESLTVHWHSTNPIFAPSAQKTNHLFVRIGDRLRIECPKLLTEFSTIHRVDQEHAEQCVLPEKHKVTAVGDCRRPGETILVTFRDFSPVPGGLEFHAGHDYYFITTSTGENTEEGLANSKGGLSTSTGENTEEGLANFKGGLCKTDNMKLRFSVLQKTQPYRQPQPFDHDDHDDEAGVVSDKPPSNVHPVGQGEPVNSPDFNGPPFNPFAMPFWSRSTGTMAPLLSDASRSDDDESLDQENVDFKIEYRYDDSSASPTLRPTLGLLFACVIFFIFLTR